MRIYLHDSALGTLILRKILPMKSLGISPNMQEVCSNLYTVYRNAHMPDCRQYTRDKKIITPSHQTLTLAVNVNSPYPRQRYAGQLLNGLAAEMVCSVIQVRNRMAAGLQ